MKTGKTYVQVFIESEKDLPKEEGKYIAQSKSDRKVMNRIYHYDAKDYWMAKVNWYLLSVEQSQQIELPILTDDKIKEMAEEYVRIFHADTDIETDKERFIHNMNYIHLLKWFCNKIKQ